MPEIILLSDNEFSETEVKKNLLQNNIKVTRITSGDDERALSEKTEAVVFLYDCNSKNINIIEQARKLKYILQTKDVRSVAMLSEENINYDILKYVNSYVTRPINENLFTATIASNLQLCNTFKELSKNNNDLAKSLYQLNVLYGTGMQLAGTLDKLKLTDIMTEGLDRGLSLSLCYALVFDEATNVRLIIKSLLPISQKLENAIKLRALLSYKNLFSINPKQESITVEKYAKDQFGEYDLNVFNFDNLFAPININNKFYGIIEVFRENDFTNDDTKCFNTLVKQVSLPLESAILYDEIKDTNIKLEKLERLKSEFISIVSHELKTPLTSVNSAIDIILNGSAGEINDTTKKFLKLAKRNVTRLSAIIYDLLDLSKIEAGKMEFRFEQADINMPVENVKNTLESWAREQKVTLKSVLTAGLGKVFIDVQRIEQVLTNLISNAIKFSGENAEVEVRTSEITAEEIRNNPFFEIRPDNLSEKYVQIAVKDNGIGIARENWNKIFEQFKQIENSLSRKVGGSGLGIPIAKRLTDAHKGFLWLESEINVGTTFYLAIPVLNEKEIFMMSLEGEIKRAVSEHINVAIISLCENVIEDKSFTDKILSEDIIRKTAIYKEISYEEDGKRYYCSYCSDIDSFVYDFEVCKLQTCIKNYESDYKKNDIKYSALLIPQDGTEIKEILEKVKSFAKVE